MGPFLGFDRTSLGRSPIAGYCFKIAAIPEKALL